MKRILCAVLGLLALPLAAEANGHAGVPLARQRVVVRAPFVRVAAFPGYAQGVPLRLETPRVYVQRSTSYVPLAPPQAPVYYQAPAVPLQLAPSMPLYDQGCLAPGAAPVSSCGQAALFRQRAVMRGY